MHSTFTQTKWNISAGVNCQLHYLCCGVVQNNFPYIVQHPKEIWKDSSRNQLYYTQLPWDNRIYHQYFYLHISVIKRTSDRHHEHSNKRNPNKNACLLLSIQKNPSTMVCEDQWLPSHLSTSSMRNICMVILAFSALCAGEAPDQKLKINKLEPHHSAALWPLIMECIHHWWPCSSIIYIGSPGT